MFVAVYLSALTDNMMKFVKQIGVEYVDLYQHLIPSYDKNLFRGLQKFDFYQNKEEISHVIKRVKENGLKINSFFAPPIRDALFGRTGGEKQIENVCKFIRLMGENQIYLVDLGIQDVAAGPVYVPGRYKKEHRGGYIMDAFSMKLFREELEKRDLNAPWSIHFTEKLSYTDYLSNCIKVLNEILPVAKEQNIKISSHFDDPPIGDERLLPGFRNHVQILELFDKVSSENFGISFCCGTRYESGTDIFKQIELFGKRKKLFHAHLRNVRGTIKTTSDYEEVALDDGEMDILEILKSFKKQGYNGAFNVDHLPEFIGDTDGKAGLCHSVAYLKGLLDSID